MTKIIDTKAKRERLSQRREPYWSKLILGGYIGYRVGAIGGSWIARFRSDDGKQNYKSLELPAHLPVNEYDTATTEARKWFDAQQAGFKPKAGTTEDATKNYIEYLEINKGADSAKDAQGRIDRYILPEFKSKPLDKLTTPDIRRWHHAFVPKKGTDEVIRKAKNSANRNLNTFKAILNRAHKDGLVNSNSAWGRVERFPKVEGSRKEYLSSDQVQTLLDNTSGSFRDLIKAGVLTGARYGELCKLRVKHFDKRLAVLNIPGGKTGARTLPLTKTMNAFFVEMAKDKLPDAPLLSKDNGDQWATSNQVKPMQEAVINSKLSPDVVFYTLRHSFIANAILSGMDLYSLAKITGTSIEMIENHYGKLFKDRVIEVLEQSALI